jgi:hypothetical protein
MIIALVYRINSKTATRFRQWATQRLKEYIVKGFTMGDERSVVKKYLITAGDNKRYNTNHYKLQTIIDVGFEVNNKRAVKFRKWAGQIVKYYTIQVWAKNVL